MSRASRGTQHTSMNDVKLRSEYALMTSSNPNDTIKWPDGIRRWNIELEDLENCGDIMPYRISNKRLSLDFDTSPLKVLGKQTPLSSRLSSTVQKYSTDHPLSLRLQKSKPNRTKNMHQESDYTQFDPNSLYGLQCVWNSPDQQEDLPMHVLCKVTEKGDDIIAEYEDVSNPAEKKIYLKARRRSEGELSNCMMRLRLSGCPVIVCHEVDDGAFEDDSQEDQSLATCLSVPNIDIENEKKRPPLPNDQVNIVVC